VGAPRVGPEVVGEAIGSAIRNHEFGVRAMVNDLINQFGSEFAIWLLGNLEFFKKAKSAVYSTWHEYLVSFDRQCEESVRTSSSAISNHRTVLIRLRRVRFVGATPAF
jgi:hypothetical protein